MRTAWLYIWLLATSQVFTDTPGNPYGIPLFNEMFLAMAVAVALIEAVRRPQWVSFAIVGGVFFAMFFSAYLAKFNYGQPLIFGFTEERRMLALLFVFPLRQAVKGLSIDDVARAVMHVALFAAALGFLYYAGAGGWVELQRQHLLVNRGNFATQFCAVAIILNLPARRWGAIVVVLAFLFVVAQTRQVVIALAVGSAVFFAIDSYKRQKSFLFLAIPGAACIAAIVLVLAPDTVLALLPERFQELGQQSYLEQSARASAYRAVFGNFLWHGHGALSLQYNNGFAGYFGEQFFLADIGILGTLHRFGIFAVPYAGAAIFLLVSAYRSSGRIAGPMRVAIVGAAFTLLATWPTAGILEYRGSIVALLMACGCAIASHNQIPRVVILRSAGGRQPARGF